MKKLIILSTLCFPQLLFSQIDSSLKKKIKDAQDLLSLQPATTDSLFLVYLNIMDSVARKNKFDTIYYCCNIMYMEAHSGIPAKGEYLDHIGKLSFTKSELRRWREWYLEKRKKKWCHLNNY